ncbi:unnamed protein product [Phytomonas sp. EM1]|nr:unnamed protein product [Phytomonas sp. EM1]|eukprot:CCW64869.1 unnamed protein product [Phytomonas sp. isolate EM1]
MSGKFTFVRLVSASHFSFSNRLFHSLFWCGLSDTKIVPYPGTVLSGQGTAIRQVRLFYSTKYYHKHSNAKCSQSPLASACASKNTDQTDTRELEFLESDTKLLENEFEDIASNQYSTKRSCLSDPSSELGIKVGDINRCTLASHLMSSTTSIGLHNEDVNNTSGTGDAGIGLQWPEPTLADLDRSIPQVDSEFIANLIRCRTVRRNDFLKRKTEIKARVEELSKQEMKTITEAVSMPRVGGWGFWKRGLNNIDETALVATSAQDNVMAPKSVLAQLTPEELDILHTTRPEYDDGFFLLDCRTVNEITSWGIIEGAKVLPAHELFEAFHATPADFLEEYGFTKPSPAQMIICYCQYGPRSLMAAQILSWMGYLNVLHFRDGYYEWSKQYNLLLRRWMEHDRSSGNELRRVATFRAALEMQREIAPEFTALAIQEASQYYVDTTRSRGRLRIGEGLRANAYAAVAKLMEEMPLPPGLPGVAEDVKLDKQFLTGQHLTKFLGQATGLDPIAAKDTGTESNMGISDAQSIALSPISSALPRRSS